MAVDYDKFLKALGARMKELRKQRNWTQRYMDIEYGINESQLRRYERGAGMDVRSMLRVAEIFGLSLSDLVNGLHVATLNADPKLIELPAGKTVRPPRKATAARKRSGKQVS